MTDIVKYVLQKIHSVGRDVGVIVMMSSEQASNQTRILELESQVSHLQKEFEAFKKYKIDRHLSWNCARGTCNACKGRSCRHKCHNKTLDDVP